MGFQDQHQVSFAAAVLTCGRKRLSRFKSNHKKWPDPVFVNHQICKFNGQYFDPSYGLPHTVSGYTDRKKYEDDAFDGSIRRTVLSPGNNPDVLHLRDLPRDDGNAADPKDEINLYEEVNVQ